MPEPAQDASISSRHVHDGRVTECRGRHCSGEPTGYRLCCPHCRHSVNFHGGPSKKGACQAFGCTCPGWIDQVGIVIARRPVDDHFHLRLETGL